MYMKGKQENMELIVGFWFSLQYYPEILEDNNFQQDFFS